MSTQKKHIVVLAHSPNVGGGELALKSLIAGSPEYSWTVVVPMRKRVNEKIRNTNAKYIYLNLPWWCHEAHEPPKSIYRPDLIRNLEKLEHIAKTADILVTNTITIPWLGAISRRLNKPHIWYVHEFGNIDHNLQFVLGYEKSLASISSLADRVLTISESVKNHLSSYIDSLMIDIVHQSIDFGELTQIPALIAPVNTKQVSLLMLGAIKPSKGQHIAVGAMGMLPKDHNYFLDIIGPAANARYTHDLTILAAKDPRVNVRLGAYSPEDELAQHDAVLMCSQNEGLGRVTLEAMAASRPVLGFSCASTKGLLQDSRGYLYSPNTSEALANLLKSTDLRTFDPIPAKKFVLKQYSESVQAKDFNTSISRALRSSVEGNKTFIEEYCHFLGDNSLLISKKQHMKVRGARIVVKHTPIPVKRVIKRILLRP